MTRIVVGSMSPIKLRAVQLALERIGLDADVVGLEVASGVPEQPYGRQQTLEGAANRARAALEACRKGEYAIGIENGLVPSGPHVLDMAYVVIYAPPARRLVRRSLGIPVPPEVVEAALSSRPARTAGDIEAERSGADPHDPHRAWSKGMTDRETILVNVLYPALLAATVDEEGESP